MKARIRLDENTRYAGFWRRAAAAIIDSLILVPLLGIILYLIYGYSYFDLNPDPTRPLTAHALWEPLIKIIAPILLTIFLWVKFLGTPGKLLLDCHLVHAETGQALSARRALLRYLAYYLSALPIMLGFLWVAWDKRKQGFHDKIANSVVVIYDESAATFEELPTQFGKEIY
ncbi:MAG: RDD family protein [Gammaproteobacteria bacterium]